MTGYDVIDSWWSKMDSAIRIFESFSSRKTFLSRPRKYFSESRLSGDRLRSGPFPTKFNFWESSGFFEKIELFQKIEFFEKVEYFNYWEFPDAESFLLVIKLDSLLCGKPKSCFEAHFCSKIVIEIFTNEIILKNQNLIK